ncbi:uncharacterized protein F5891DRAFT_963419 [Suillus fuscotomentosus]|uniref:Uncharacterized protein n=1 Tax=Suillus fuscotomentosus TaxID=1912939 RepID=A0AAD4DSI6_9AGAM|nr:uncharacterized protein F5891DRAFT_963419 [Suillus fuscotomentosus]KAG1893136.1 hypothetical protein F5891DRAFT_963419 [Suillus fuscotomentosus]
MYLVGIIPGPREPALEEINHFFRPVVDFFLPSWKDGIWFTKTINHTAGRLSRSVIAVAVNDLPAARKLAGRAGPTTNQMCRLCWLLKSDITDFDCKKWRRHTLEEHKAAAEEWVNAESKVECDKIFKQHGVRWSELLRLPYWDPMRFIVIDGMHNLFLGLVQHHFRDGPKGSEVLSDNKINAIQEKLGNVQRPTWHCGLPKNLGDTEHGKFKVEQWKSSIEFDLPVALMQLWGSKHTADGTNADRKSQLQKLVHSTMLLVIAIRWGTSHVTSSHHAQQYTRYMKAYLESIKGIFTHHSWRPNHHAALHIREFLLRYGPMHGWWMFPFERIISALQKTNTNYKIGERAIH